tara:strand:- start:696 stop:1019 length:324 start_codon:yes stop_codon:yes gene_type:complete
MTTTVELKEGTKAIHSLEFEDEDWEKAKIFARELGYSQTAYTSHGVFNELACIPDREDYDMGKRGGRIIKTAELGFMFIQLDEDILGCFLEEFIREHFEQKYVRKEN